jgi:hypothetical protein
MYKYVRMCFCIRKERNDFLIPDRQIVLNVIRPRRIIQFSSVPIEL